VQFPSVHPGPQIETAGLFTFEAGYLLRRLDKEVTQHSVPFLLKLASTTGCEVSWEATDRPSPTARCPRASTTT
jgi:hypothetical protein